MSDPYNMGRLAYADWHFWSIDEMEKDQFLTEGTHWKEGMSFWAPKEEQGRTLPVFRFFNKALNHHYWSTNPNEITDPAWVHEGPKYHVFDPGKPQPTGTRPLICWHIHAGPYFHHFWSPTPENELVGGWDPRPSMGYVYAVEPVDPAIKSAVNRVHEYFAELVHRQWTCRLTDGHRNLRYATKVDGTTREDAQSACEAYRAFVAGTVDKSAIGYEAHVDPS